MTLPRDAREIFRKPATPAPPPTGPRPLTDAERQVLQMKVGGRCHHARPPDAFAKALLEAFFTADGQQFQRLETLFPEQAAAVRRWRSDPLFAPVHSTEPP